MKSALISMITSLLVAGMIKPIADYFMWKKAKKAEVLTDLLRIISKTMNNLTKIIDEKHNKSLTDLEFEINKTDNFMQIEHQYEIVNLYVSQSTSHQIKKVIKDIWATYGRLKDFGQHKERNTINKHLHSLQLLIKSEMQINLWRMITNWLHHALKIAIHQFTAFTTRLPQLLKGTNLSAPQRLPPPRRNLP